MDRIERPGSRDPGPGTRDSASPLRIAVLASGQGTTLQAILDACAAGHLAASVVGVFSDRPGVPAMARAHAAGVPARALAPADYPDRAAFDRALFEYVVEADPELIVLAGYLRIIDAAVVRRLYPRMINLHPSLLPKFPGLHTHARALAAGEREHGASVHLVTPELDAGPLLAQVRVPVLADDTAISLEARVRARERPLLLATLAAVAAGRLELTASGPRYRGRALTAPLMLDEHDRLEPPA